MGDQVKKDIRCGNSAEAVNYALLGRSNLTGPGGMNEEIGEKGTNKKVPADLFEGESVRLPTGDEIILMNVAALYIFEDRCTGTDHVFQIVLTSNGCYMIQSCYRRSNLFAGFNLTEFWNAIITTGDHVLKHPGSFRVSKKLVNRLISDLVAGNLSDEICNVVFGEKFGTTTIKGYVIQKHQCTYLERFRGIMDTSEGDSIGRNGLDCVRVLGEYPEAVSV